MQRAQPPYSPSSRQVDTRLAYCRESFLNTLHEAAKEVIQHSDWLEGLAQAAGECFDELAGSPVGEYAKGVTASRISLVHDHDMDFAVELMNMEQRLRSFCKRELSVLHLRMKEVFEAAGRTLGAELPVGPEAVCRALRDFRDTERLSADEALQFIEQLEPSLCSHLCSYYRNLEHRLVEPIIEAAPSRSTAPPVCQLAWSDGPVARGSLPMDPVASLRLAVLARCEGAGVPRSMDASLAAALVERVDAWLVERQRYGEGVPASVGGSELGALLAPPRAAAVEIIETICNYAARLAALPAPIRTVMGQLRVPLLRLALRSESLLAEPRHPALRLVDLIADLGRGMAPDASPELPVLQSLMRLAQSLLKAPRIDDKDAMAALAKVESILEARKQAALSRAAVHGDTAQRLERREVALLQASQAVSAMSAGYPDSVAREFVEGYWLHVLAKAAYRYGPGSPKWVAREQVAQRLLESARPDPDADRRQMLMTQLPALMAGLEDGLRYIGLSEAHVREGLAPCRNLIAALVAAHPLPAPSRRQPMGPSLSVQAGCPHLQVLRHKQHFVGDLSLPAEWADVEIGSPVAVGLPDGKVMQGVVALIGPAQQLVLIADPDSPVVLAVTARALAHQASLAPIRVLRPVSLVDEAATDKLINP